MSFRGKDAILSQKQMQQGIAKAAAQEWLESLCC